MAQKIKDLAVKVGTYRDNQGLEKGRYVNCGVIMQGDDGNIFVLLDRTFNPAGVPDNGKDTVLISAFDPQGRNQQPQGQMQPNPTPPGFTQVPPNQHY